MNRKSIVYKLKSLIEDWETENRKLEEMIISWEQYDDPCSDPGLQAEQDDEVNSCWDELRKFCVNFNNIENDE